MVKASIILTIVRDISDNKPYMVREVMCAKCLKRWWTAHPVDTPLINHHCPDCGPGHVIATGQSVGEKPADNGA